MTSVLKFTYQPIRAIQVLNLGDELRAAFYAGNAWVASWRTEIGQRALGLDALTVPSLRCGLPIVVHEPARTERDAA